MQKGSKVKIYTDDIVTWEGGVLMDQYQVSQKDVLEKWSILTNTGTTVVRYVKNSKEFKKDGCGYLI